MSLGFSLGLLRAPALWRSQTRSQGSFEVSFLQSALHGQEMYWCHYKLGGSLLVCGANGCEHFESSKIVRWIVCSEILSARKVQTVANRCMVSKCASVMLITAAAFSCAVVMAVCISNRRISSTGSCVVGFCASSSGFLFARLPLPLQLGQTAVFSKDFDSRNQICNKGQG